MSLIQFLRILAARQSIVWATLLAALFTAIVVSQVLPPRYEARARVILDIVKPDPITGLPSTTNMLRNYISTQIELIKDIQTAGPVIDQLGWATDPRLIAAYSNSGDTSDDIRGWLAARITAATNAKLLEQSNILEISYQGSSRDSAKQIATMLRDTFVQQNLEQRKQTAARSADWYREQTDKALLLLTAAETARTDYAKKNGIVLQPNNTDLESSKLASLSQQSATPMPNFSMPAMSSPARAQLDTVNQQLAQAATTLGPNHPVFQSLQRQRQVLEAEVARSSRGGGVTNPGATMAQIEGAYQAQKSRVLGQQDKLDKLSQMQTDIDLKREQYQKSAQRAAELRQEADVGETDLSPLGDATVPNKPTFPNVPLILAGAIAAGLGLGVCLAILVELLGRRVRSDDDLEIAAEAPVFAIVGIKRNPNTWTARLSRFLNRRVRSRSRVAAGI